MEQTEYQYIIRKLTDILLTLQKDIRQEKQQHQREVELLRNVIADKDQHIRTLSQQLERKQSFPANWQASKAKEQIRKPLLARKRSEISTNQDTNLLPVSTKQTDSTVSRSMVNSHSHSFLLCSQGGMISSKSSMEKWEIKGSQKKKKRKQNPKYLKIDILNKQNKQSLTLSVKSALSTPSSQPKVLTMFQSLKSKAKNNNKEYTEAVLSRDKPTKMVQSKEEKRQINVYLPTKGLPDKPQWR